MEPIFRAGDRILALSPKLAGTLRRGDVVFFKNGDFIDYRVKRVIGLPGEKLEIIKGKVHINDRLLSNYIHNLSYTSNHGPVSIPNDHYFLMGDNRNVSEDSRNFGPISFERIYFKGLAIYRPLSHFKILP